MKRHWRSRREKKKKLRKNDTQKNEFRLVWLRTTQINKRTATVRYDRFRRISPSQRFQSGIFGSIRMHFKLFAFVVFGMVLPFPLQLLQIFIQPGIKITQIYLENSREKSLNNSTGSIIKYDCDSKCPRSRFRLVLSLLLLEIIKKGKLLRDASP